MPEKTFVLVHGMWHHGALWSSVARLLREPGHDVHTPTLPGFGDTAPNAGRTYGEQVDAVTELVTGKDLRDVVLVGHSYGGAIIAGVAQQIPGRIARLVFAHALVPRNGARIADDFPPTDRLDVDEHGRVLVPPFELMRDRFFGDTDHDTALRHYKRLEPCPAGPLTQTLDLQRFYDLLRDGTLRCSYLHGTEDTSITPGAYGLHPRHSERLGTYRLVIVDGGHETMLTAPELFAQRLELAGRG